MTGLTLHIALPTTDAAAAWDLMARFAGQAEDLFEVEVDAEDMHVTLTANWAQHVEDPYDGDPPPPAVGAGTFYAAGQEDPL